MKKFFVVAAFVLAIGGAQLAMAQTNGNGVGNPWPGFPHDTIILHAKKASSGATDCNGGHALFLRYNDLLAEPAFDAPIYFYITMIDWVDTNNDGIADVDEPGGITAAIDCDSLTDNKVSLLLRDTDGRPGWVSIQRWFIRMIGKPNQYMEFTTWANQTWTCTITDPDGIANSGDETVSCTTGTTNNTGDWIQLTDPINLGSNTNTLANGTTGPCVKQVKENGNGQKPGGGKTQFCDITFAFQVEAFVDTSDPPDGTLDDIYNGSVFGVQTNCLDDPETTTVIESNFCPLSGIVWTFEEGDTSIKAKAQIFVSHSGLPAKIQKGEICRGNNCD